jgi:phosphoribosylglycinamide formyltransferase-1
MALKLGFLASHGGSSMKAIIAAIRAGRLDAEPRLVISNNASSAALEFARAEALPWRHISAASTADPDATIAQALQAAGVELVILSGYMRRLGPRTLERFKGRILNIHPALLPKHGGQGMYGRRVHEAVHAAGDAVTGASIHLVESEYDTGPVMAQREAPIGPGDTVEDIENRVRELEPALFVDTLRGIADGKIQLP